MNRTFTTGAIVTSTGHCLQSILIAHKQNLVRYPIPFLKVEALKNLICYNFLDCKYPHSDGHKLEPEPREDSIIGLNANGLLHLFSLLIHWYVYSNTENLNKHLGASHFVLLEKLFSLERYWELQVLKLVGLSNWPISLVVDDISTKLIGQLARQTKVRVARNLQYTIKFGA